MIHINTQSWQRVDSPALTLFPSSQRVTMTMMEDCCSQTILQKSLTVSSFGPMETHMGWLRCDHQGASYQRLADTVPWAAMYFLDSL